jgi:hypothetical protein
LQLLNKKGKALILSEYGVGGGIHQNGSVPAQTADEAASLPFFGIFGAYNPKTGVTAGFEAQTCQLCFAWRVQCHAKAPTACNPLHHEHAFCLFQSSWSPEPCSPHTADPWKTIAPESEHVVVRNWRRRFYK